MPAMLARGRCHTVHRMDPLTDRRAAWRRPRLYFVCDGRPGGRALRDVLPAALAGGVDVFQLRDKLAGDAELLRVAAQARALCDDAGALFVLNDRPDLAVAAGADGVHVGQDDQPVAAARAVVGPDRLVGLSTHGVAQADAAAALDADYIAVGPVHATPTKPGRPAIGLEPVRHAARTVARAVVRDRGHRRPQRSGRSPPRARARVVVVRAIAEAADPERGRARPARRARAARPRSGGRWGGVAASAGPARSARLPCRARHAPPRPRRRPRRRRASRAARRATPRSARGCEPLAPDERPARCVIAAGLVRRDRLAATSSPSLAGAEVSGRRPDRSRSSFLAVLFLIAGYGMWQKRYWAVIGFQALLGFTIVFASLALLVASNVPSALLCVALIGLGGWLFWKLVRVMSRIQVPRPGGRQGTGLR